MKKRLIVLTACLSFCGGILALYFSPKKFIDLAFWYFCLALINAVLLIIFHKNKKALAIFLAGAFLFAGAWRCAVSFPSSGEDKIWHYNGQKAKIIAVVSREPVRKIRSQKLELKSLFLESRKVNGKISVITNLYPEYNYGDILEISCRLEKPGKIDDFDYGRYLAIFDIYSTCNFPKIKLISEKDALSFLAERKSAVMPLEFWWKTVFVIRAKLREPIEAGLSEPSAGILRAFLLGDQGSIPDDVSDSFRQSGLSHIIAISGTHITILLGIVFYLLLFCGLGRRQAFWISLPILFFYVFLAGAPASAARAGVMGFLFLWAAYLGRLNRLDHSLYLAALAMLLINPKQLIFDAGFQLSFLAVLGMFYLYPVFDKFFSRFYEERPRILKLILQAFALTLAAQIFTAPILLFNFRQFSFVSPLSNILVFWVSPLIMGLGLGAIFLSFLVPGLAIFFFLPCHLLLEYMILVADWTAKIPFAYFIFK